MIPWTHLSWRAKRSPPWQGQMWHRCFRTSQPPSRTSLLYHLDKCGKSQYNMVSHKLERDDIGKVTGVAPEETTCLPLPTSAPKKKTLSLDNIAGYIDIDIVKKSKRVMIIHNLVCPSTTQTSIHVHPSCMYIHKWTHVDAPCMMQTLYTWIRMHRLFANTCNLAITQPR